MDTSGDLPVAKRDASSARGRPGRDTKSTSLPPVKASPRSNVVSLAVEETTGIPHISAPEMEWRTKLKIKPSYRGPVFVPENSGLVCAACRQSVDRVSRVLIGNTPFHPRCLKCCICAALNENIYLDYKGKPICKRCSTRVPEHLAQAGVHSSRADSQACKGCGHPLEGKLVFAFGAHWHHRCFKCTACGDVFSDATGSFAEKNGRPYHIECLASKSAEMPTTVQGQGQVRSARKQPANPCSGCGKRITGDFVELDGMGRFHTTCVKCAGCERVIANQYVQEERGSSTVLLCLECAQPPAG